MGAVDPITLSVVQARLTAITKEMGETMLRTSRGPIFHEARDFVTAIFDHRGRLLAQTEYNPILLASTPFAVRSVGKFFEGEIYDGDVYILNDPYHGNTHLPDITLLRPVFHQGRHLFWAVAKGHHTDVGGPVPGSHNPRATEIWQEGTRIPPVKIYERHTLRKDMWNLILTNTRMMETVRGDLRSQVGASKIGERDLLRLVDKYGAQRLAEIIEAMLDAAERRVRQEIRRVPNGHYKAERCIEHDGIDKGKMIAVRLTLTVKDDEIIYDFTGTDPQVKGWVNSPLPNTVSAAYISLFSVIDPDIPHNAGAHRPITVIAPEGSVINPLPPAPTVLSTVTPAEVIIETTWLALSQAIPEETPAGWTRWSGQILAGVDPRSGAMFGDFLILRKGGGGAIKGHDGWSHIGTPVCGGGLRAPDVEMHEIQDPVTVLNYEYRTDSGGAGRWRGGLGVRYIWRCDADIATAVNFGDGHSQAMRPFGLSGGGPGLPNRNLLHRTAGEVIEVDSKEIYPLDRGDIFEVNSAGGGGWGDPFARPVDLVVEDVLNGYISPESARLDYRVVVNPVSLELDRVETARLRGRANDTNEGGENA